MRVLIVTPTPTHPTNQGNRARVLQVARGFKEMGAIVELLYYAIDGLEDGSAEAMRAAWDAVHIAAMGGFRPVRRYPDCWGLDDWVSPRLIEAVRHLESVTHYDAVVVNYVWLSALLPIFDGATTVRLLDTHDAFGDRHRLARTAGLQPNWFYTTKAEEARGLDRADTVLAIQSDEGVYFRGLTHKPVEVVEYARPPTTLDTQKASRLTIGYLGSGNPWNVQSVLQFDTIIAARPDVYDLRQRANFLLFGGITRSVSGLKIFRSMGMVKDVRDAYAMIDLIVNPMIGGTGLKIKTVEALAFGKPVLTTQAGGAGLETIHADLLYENLESLGRRMVELLDHPQQLAEIQESMRDSYSKFYADVNARLKFTLEKVLAGGGRIGSA